MDFKNTLAAITNFAKQSVEAVSANNYDVYLKNEKENDTFHFPVNPIENITLNRSKKYETADIVDFGEVDLSDKGKKIKELSFSTLLPKEYDTYCRYNNIPKPNEAMEKLEKWMEQESPLRLIITGFNFNDLVIISKIDEEERAGEAGDKYISIGFRTNRELKIEVLSEHKADKLKNSRSTSSPGQYSYHRAGSWVEVTAPTLPVRDGPGDNSKQIGTIKKGQSYKVGRIQGNWADIYWGDHGGWICLDYVR